VELWKRRTREKKKGGRREIKRKSNMRSNEKR
jgi:hypothetical protein